MGRRSSTHMRCAPYIWNRHRVEVFLVGYGVVPLYRVGVGKIKNW